MESLREALELHLEDMPTSEKFIKWRNQIWCRSL